MRVRGVVFDAGGVLERVDDADWPARWLQGWSARAGVPVSEVEDHLARHEAPGAVATGAVSEAQLRELYASALGLPGAAAEQLMAQVWDLYCGSLDEEMRSFCASLRPRYRTAILTNSADGARPEERLGLTGPELVLIDDVQANVDAAVECGWAGVLHQTSAATIEQVRALLG